MLVEIYTPEKPPVRGRAVWVSLMLLGVACLLAGSMSRHRRTSPPDVRFAPPGWAIRFQPPPGFLTFTEGPTEMGYAYRFLGHGEDNSRVMLMVLRLDPPFPKDRYLLAHRILDRLTPKSAALLALPRESRPDVRLGPWPAHEMWDPLLEILVRVAVVDGRDAYAVLLIVDGRITHGLYQAFEKVCDSVEPP